MRHVKDLSATLNAARKSGTHNCTCSSEFIKEEIITSEKSYTMEMLLVKDLSVLLNTTRKSGTHYCYTVCTALSKRVNVTPRRYNLLDT